ncbi:MAG: xanthine dehydrogenase family protein molybdopterin-binding subunit [Alphaproteobacteria bacterium]|nr:xanthine dehydrogenase family protein molybdopterin-binding subunit [Alphaproteobacteria bacterium]
MSISRRRLLQAAGALVVAAQLPPALAATGGPTEDALNPFVAVQPDGRVVVYIPSSEMGQGVRTSLPQLVMEELDADWAALEVEQSPEGKPYRMKMAPGLTMQLTGGSMSVKYWGLPLRVAGAQARWMLVAAAAERWGVDPEACSTQDSVVTGPGGETATYADLVPDAVGRKAPRSPPLKAESERTLIGRSIPRTDALAKVTGAAEFGVDVRVEGMRFACSVACPVIGGTVLKVDDAAARAIPGVLDVFVFDDFVAVVAEGWWPAKRGASALEITWDEGPAAGLSTAEISRRLAEGLAAGDAKAGRDEGDAARVIDGDPDAIDVTYEVPFLDHATMEPLNCTVHVTPERCDVWVGTQAQTRARKAAAEITGLPLERVHVHTTYLGGGFGRRGFTDYVEQAVKVALAADAPVQLLWTREEGIRHGFYRPAAAARMRASLSGGQVQALHARLASQNILHSLLPRVAWGITSDFAMEGLLESSPYRTPNLRVDWKLVDLPVPIGFWRSVGHSYAAFFMESFIDELAHALGQDPVNLRRALIDEAYPRHRRVLDEVVQRAGWGEAPAGHFQGVALHESFGSIAAEVVELRMEGGLPRVMKVTGVVDCGEVVNPGNVHAQLMGGALYGLCAALNGKLDFEGGRVVQSNFHDYPLLRMSQSPPEVDMHVLTTPGAEVGGIGELGTPPAAPALCNALFAATGVRVRKLPVLAALQEARR